MNQREMKGIRTFTLGLLLALCVACTKKEDRKLVLYYENPTNTEELRAQLEKGFGVPVADIQVEYGSYYNVLFKRSPTKIRAHAFDGSESFTSVTIPNTVREIEDFAFLACGALERASLPEKVNVGANAFHPKTKIIYRIPEKVKEQHSLKGYEWLEGKWEDRSFDVVSYQNQHNIIITKKYYQEIWDEEAVVEDQPKQKIAIRDADNKNESLEHRYKSIGSFHIDEETQRLFWIYDFDQPIYLTKVDGPDSRADRRKANKQQKEINAASEWTRRMKKYDGVMAFRSQYRWGSRDWMYYSFVSDSEDGCQGTMNSIEIEFSASTNLPNYVRYTVFTAQYEIQGDRIHFTDCYIWRRPRLTYENFPIRRIRMSETFDGTWYVRQGMLIIDSKLYNDHSATWNQSGFVEDEDVSQRFNDEIRRISDLAKEGRDKNGRYY